MDALKEEKKQMEMEVIRTREKSAQELTELKENLDRLQNSLESSKVMLKQEEYTVELTKKTCEEELAKVTRVHEENMTKLEKEKKMVQGKLDKIKELNDRLRGRTILTN